MGGDVKSNDALRHRGGVVCNDVGARGARVRRWDVRGGWYFYFRVRVALVVRGQGASRGVDGWWVV